MKAMIFAAGLGTRLRPLTNDKPKALVEVADTTLLEHTINTLVAAGVTEIVVNVHHLGNLIIDFIAQRQWPIPIHISDEREQLLDTGGGLRKAIKVFESKEEPILIHNVDIFSNAPLADICKNQPADVAATLVVSRRNSTRQLYFHPETHRLMGWQNLTTGEIRSPFASFNTEECEAYAFSGIHIVNPSLFPTLAKEDDVFPIMNFYLKHCAELSIIGHVEENLQLLDVGKIESIRLAEDFVRKTHEI